LNERHHSSKLVSPPPQHQQQQQQQQQKVTYYTTTGENADDQQLAALTQSLNMADTTTASRKSSAALNHQDHWLVYKQDEMPQRILDAKKRLGQMKDPRQAPPAAATHVNDELRQQLRNSEALATQVTLAGQRINPPPAAAPSGQSSSLSTNSTSHMTPTVFDPNGRNWMQWDNPQTPENIKMIRARLGDDRYKKMSDRIVRCKTASVRTTYDDYERSKPATSNNNNNNRPQTSVNRLVIAEQDSEQHHQHEQGYGIPMAYQIESVPQPQPVLTENVTELPTAATAAIAENIMPIAYEQHNQVLAQIQQLNQHNNNSFETAVQVGS
jgi:hypothetical protein